ncbi:MAG: PAS domain S-box protein, partial [Longimicrobiales bacterium]
VLRARAVLAVPLVGADGQVLGSLVAASTAPRAWSDTDAAVLEDLAALAVTEVELWLEAAARHGARAALESSERLFRSIIEHASDVVLICDAAGRIEYASPALERVLGYRRATIAGRTLSDLTHPQDRLSVDAALRALLATGAAPALDLRAQHVAGGWRVLEGTGSRHVDGERTRLIVHLHDATDSRESAAEARRQQHYFESLFEWAPAPIALIDHEDRVLRTNQAFCELFGYAQDELLGGKVNDFIVPAQLREQAESWTTRVHGGEAMRQETVRRRKDGSEVHVSIVATPFDDADGRRRIYVVYRDVTERKQFEEALRTSERRFRSLIENAADGIVLLDGSGKVVYESPSTQRMTGYTEEERVGRSAFEFLHPDDVARVQEEFVGLLSEPGTTRSVVFRYRHKNGEWRDFAATARNLLADPAVRAVVINSRDVTDARKLEEQLHHAQKLEAVGQLAGGVAHDFNNLLTSVLGLTHLLLDSAELHAALRDDVVEIERAVERGVALTRQLLAFSRKQLLRPRVVALNAVISEMMPFIGRLVGEMIAVELELEPQLACVRADPGQLQQVIMNLAVNARDAMPHGGRLRIRTSAVRLDGHVGADRSELEPGDYVALEVSDTGTGFNESVREHLFEPFFTTKEQGKGTGLGLATIYGIVKQSGGDVVAHSNPDEGATFRIYLPQVEGEPEAQPTEARAPRDGRPGARVLLVEDEPGVRALASRVLQRSGYCVLEAEDGGAALDLLEREPAAIDLVVTDVIMPGMSGRTLADHIADRRPGVPVLFMSGYTRDELGIHGVLDDTPFLAKPFAPAALVQKVAELLG